MRHFFPASAALISQRNGADGETCCNAKPIRSAKKSCATTSPKPTCMETSKLSMAPSGAEKSTCSPAAFRASLFPLPDADEERQTTVSSGQRCFDLWLRAHQNGSSLKTFMASFLSKTAWYSDRCSMIWSPQITSANRSLFRLAAFQHHTFATDFGLLPTVVAADSKDRGWCNRGGRPLTQIVKKRTGLKLQPAFCAWLMGYPLDWTLAPFLASDSAISRCALRHVPAGIDRALRARRLS